MATALGQLYLAMVDYEVGVFRAYERFAYWSSEVERLVPGTVMTSMGIRASMERSRKW